MTLQYRAAVLHAAQKPLSIETVTAAGLQPADVLVRVRAAGLCHTDLEVIEGSLRYPLPTCSGTKRPASSNKWARPRAA
jgi:S-(hydroxymethyl)glutathione dehydrogenase / alcohol dehydrogenase